MADLGSQFLQLFSYSMCPLPVHLPSILHEFEELLKASMAPLRSYPGEPFRQILQRRIPEKGASSPRVVPPFGDASRNGKATSRKPSLPLPRWERVGVRGDQFPHRIPPSPPVGEGRGEGETSRAPDHPPLTPPIKGGEEEMLPSREGKRGRLPLKEGKRKWFPSREGER